jgi:chromosome segregation ATPase
MDQQSEQLTMNQNTPCSIPQTLASSSRVLEFLQKVARNTRAESTATDCKIAQLSAQRKRLREDAKEIKQRIREQTERLRLAEQEIDNINLSISHLNAIREDEEMDMK